MMKAVDNLLNRITMYRLVLYYLIFLLAAALMLSLVGVLSYDPTAILFSTAFLLVVCALTNGIFARTFGVPSNVESTYISALILALIITPLQSYSDLWFLGWAGVLAMASKYIVGFRGKHLFNPVALAVALTYFTINQSASWWVGNASLLPFVLVGGVLVVMKIRRFDMVISFLVTALTAVGLAALLGGTNLFAALGNTLLYSPLAFFAFVMLTEPLTAPPTHTLRVYYGILVGLLFTPLIHFDAFYTTPEVALLVGNLFSYIVSPKSRLLLRLKGKTRLAPDIYEFVFGLPHRLAFAPGQYMEWTLGHDDPDSRGNRRYFTLASAPTESELRLGVKLYQGPSSFKKALVSMTGGSEIVAAQLGGDFVLPEDPKQKCIFIAGGIGVTPFRSMIKYLLDTRQSRPILMFYSNQRVEEIVYRDVFDRAARELGIYTIYTVTDPANLPPNWQGGVGRINPQWIAQAAPDYRSCFFYISGSVEMVHAMRDMLRKMGVREAQIKTDYFAGLA
jgi:glycine betaine catabolism B